MAAEDDGHKAPGQISSRCGIKTFPGAERFSNKLLLGSCLERILGNSLFNFFFFLHETRKFQKTNQKFRGSENFRLANYRGLLVTGTEITSQVPLGSIYYPT